jgi:diguanylate cyclase (GGDEF)-like protein
VDPVTAHATLTDAAHTVARGRDIESQLQRLAEHALALSGAASIAIYLLDPMARRLVPAATAGPNATPAERAAVVGLDDEAQLVAQVVRERRAGSGPGGTGSRVALPLIAADSGGTEEAEGALVADFAADGHAAGADDSLAAIADLAAVAIRKARLESALVERSDWIERLASTDALTGIANRATLERMLELEIARATRQATQVSVVLFDIDGLAALNEKAGAHAGDDALRRLASLLADQVRLVDTIGRVGADEFGIIAPGGGGMVVAQRVAAAAREIKLADGSKLSVSAANVIFPADGASSTELMAAAEAALATAKARGRGSIVNAGEG